jgi:hypothetical protein
MLNPALLFVIGDNICMLCYFNCDIMSFGIAGETLEIMILLAGFIKRLILIDIWAFNVILGRLIIRKSTVFLSLKYIQNRLFDI